LNYVRVLRLVPPPLALALIVMASSLPYLFQLGFYADDWSFLAEMSGNARQSFGALYGGLDASANLHARPVQIMQMIVLYKAFGVAPLGYHVVNTATLAATAVLMHLALRRLELPAAATFAAASIFALSPAYSTNRFWFASFGYVLMMALYFGSLYSELRAFPDGKGKIDWRWKVSALILTALCGLGYEVAIPLLVGSQLLMAYRFWRGGGLRAGRLSEVTLSFVSSGLVLAVVLAFKVATAIGVEIRYGPLAQAARLGASAATVQFGSYGLALPTTTWWAAHESGVAALVVAVAVALFAAAYLALLCREPPEPARSDRVRLLTYGVMSLFLGYAIFLITPRFSAASTGVDNRINIGGTLGVSLLVVGATWGVSRFRPIIRRYGPAVVVGLFSFSFTLSIGAVSKDWVEAYREQQLVLDGIEKSTPAIPRGAVVILAGRCPYRGPGIVFESSWDLSGALAVRRGGPPPTANVVTPRMEVYETELVSRIYGEEDGRYPFGPQLYLYDDRQKRAYVLRDLAAAESHLGSPGAPLAQDCRPGVEGWGEPVLPLERLLAGKWLVGGPTA
jgi:hypothetical protein